MSKEIEGYFNKDNEPTATSDPALNILFKAIRSHDGWLCPHCGAKSNMHEEEMGNQRYMELIHEYTPMEMLCGHCDEKYYLKAHMTTKYYTCVDESFGEDE